MQKVFVSTIWRIAFNELATDPWVLALPAYPPRSIMCRFSSGAFDTDLRLIDVIKYYRGMKRWATKSSLQTAGLLRRPIFGVLILLLMFGSLPSARSAQGKTTVEGNSAFALDLFSRLKSSPGNIFFSPYSISTALAMTYAGARGDTERQMARVLHFSEDRRQLHSALRELQHSLGEASTQKGIELSIANALWAQKGHPFLPAFTDI